MNDVKSLLTNTMNPQNRLMQETRGLVAKWDKTGLLEGLKNDMEKSNMSVLLENQAKQLIDEATQTGTSANSEQWAGVALPLVRRVFAEIAAKEFVSVQPMNLPSGLVFYLDFKYGTTQGQFAKDGSTLGGGAIATSSLYGGTGTKLGSTDSATGGLYGAGRFGYTLNDQNIAAAVSVSSASLEDINYDVNLSASVSAGKIWRVSTTDLYTGTTNAGNVFDVNAVRSFVIYGPAASSSYYTPANTSASYYPALTKQFGTEVVFIMTASAALGGAPGMGGGGANPLGGVYRVIYSVQPKDSNRGDFEDRGTPDATFGLNNNIGIPEVNLELKSEPIVAKTRKLKAVWTPELAQDLNAYHSIDAEAELTALLSEYVSMEIDLEILDMLITNAPAITTERWSAKLNREIQSNGDGTFAVVDQTVAGTGGYYTKDTWYRTLGIKIQKVSNKIHQLTLRGGANFLVCSPDVATILESIPGWNVNTDGDQAKFAMGVTRVGSFQSRFQVYKNPYMTDNVILVGFRGNNFLETGAVYAPYIPLVQTPLVYDPVNFTPRRGVMTRYAKKLVRPEFYGRILVGDLNAV